MGVVAIIYAWHKLPTFMCQGQAFNGLGGALGSPEVQSAIIAARPQRTWTCHGILRVNHSHQLCQIINVHNAPGAPTPKDRRFRDANIRMSPVGAKRLSTHTFSVLDTVPITTSMNHKIPQLVGS